MTRKVIIPEDDDSAAARGDSGGEDTTVAAAAAAAVLGTATSTTTTAAACPAASTYLGIDFGTSNSAAAIWDSSRGHPKWMRLGRHDLATRNNNNNTKKAGRIVPSAVLFVSKAAVAVAVDDDDASHYFSFNNLHHEDTVDDVSSILGRSDVVVYVGAAAMKIAEQAFDNNETTNNTESSSSSSSSSVSSSVSSFPYSSEQVSRALVTSVKRILGMKKRQQHSSSSSDDNNNNKESSWIESLPFELVMVDDKTRNNVDNDDDESNMKKKKNDNDDETVLIRVYPLGMTTTTTTTSNSRNSNSNSNSSITVTPEQVVAIILQSIRLAAQDYLLENMVKKRLQVPGGAGGLSSSSTTASACRQSISCTNCVLGVPAHFGQVERQTLLRAAHLAGFHGGSDNYNDNNNNDNNGRQEQQEQQQGTAAKVVVSVLTESTAAAMAYGLFVGASGGAKNRTNDKNNQNNGTTNKATTDVTSILVFDMGGGTTDVTIAEMTAAGAAVTNDDDDDDDDSFPRFKVKVTHGNSHLGGDDMDEALVRLVLTKLAAAKEQGKEEHAIPSSSSLLLLSPSEHRSLLRQCRSAKERLCGDVDHGLTKPEECVTITMKNSTLNEKKRSIDITQQDLTQALAPILTAAEQVVQTALDRYYNSKAMMLPSSSSSSSCEESKAAAATAENDDEDAHTHTPPTRISEVVLVGGATRVLGVRDMLQRLFPPPPDLCLSVNAMSAVAQGTAIKAAMDSKCIPLHELRSAMMLDTTPHAIGVLLSDNKDETTTTTTQPRFVEIIPRDEPLPASGVATFQLADARQAGISLTAVEEVVEHETKEGGGGGRAEIRRRRLIYPKLGDFTFLLHRLSEQRIAELKDGIRSVDISMTLKENGALVVSFFDANDPEHMAKRQKQQQQQQQKKRRSKRDNASTSTFEEAALLEYSAAPSNTDDDDMNDMMDKGLGFSKEQLLLIGYCILLMVLYVTAKLVFHEELKRFKEE